MSRAFALQLILATALGAATAPAAAAQWSYRMDLGGAAADGPAREAPLLLDARLAWASPRFTLSLAGGNAPTSVMPGGAHGRLTAAMRALSWGGDDGWRGAIEVAGTVARRSDFLDATREEITVGPRLAHGAWIISADISTMELHEWESRRATAAALTMRREFLFGALVLGAKRVAFADSQTVTRDTTYHVAGFEYKSTYRQFGRGRREYVDALVGFDFYLPRASLGLTLGGRGTGIDGAARAWGSVDALVPLREGLALHLAGGRTGGIPEQRFDASRFVSLALQLTGGPRRLYEEITPTSGGEPRFQLIEASGGAHLIRVTGFSASQVQIRADFTQWDAVALEAAPGTGRAWQRSFMLAPGVHRILIRIDEGEWQAPPDLPVERDEFGERIGVLYVGVAGDAHERER